MKSRVNVWRDAIRDSELDRTAKLVAHTLSTYMRSTGLAWPSQDTVALGASISDRAVHRATKTLEVAGYLVVERSRGRSSHRYQANLPSTANELRRSEWANSERPFSNPEQHVTNRERRSPESVEDAESTRRAHQEAGEASLTREPCPWCGELFTHDGTALSCPGCLAGAVTA